MSQLAIKGHATRGEEVIKILEMLGGSNKHNYSPAWDCLCVYIGKGTNIITWDWVNNCYEDEDILVFTLEEFLEKFPYKVGDKVYYENKVCDVIEMIWNSNLNTISYGVYDGKMKNLAIIEELKPYKEETMDKANKAVFDTNAQCCDIMNHIIKEKSMKEIKIDIPKGYEFAGVDDDNQQVVFTKIGYHYPKTYEECCEVLFPNSLALGKVLASGYNCELLERLGKLLICRDAYWKIAGDWKPDWENDTYKYVISNNKNHIVVDFRWNSNTKLSFPTEEMRDAFYTNFKKLIEECKELL